jgi:hypothetical protein
LLEQAIHNLRAYKSYRKSTAGAHWLYMSICLKMIDETSTPEDSRETSLSIPEDSREFQFLEHNICTVTIIL